jgi:Secretion system C-terminal sorting domain
MKENKLIWLLSLLVLLLISGSVLFAQYQISSSVFGNGGVPVSSAVYSINSTIGQTFIGAVENAGYQHDVGFWYSTRVYVGIEAVEDQLPKKFELYQNYPNPFNPVTNIKYAVPKPAHVRIEIYNILGQRVRTLLNEEKSPGYYVVGFDASSLASGFYIYRMQAEGFVDIRKMIVTK